MDEIISSYSLEQALEDGTLVKVFTYNHEEFVSRYTDGKPVVATAHLFNEIGTRCNDIWNTYVTWRLEVMPTLPEEERTFVMQWHGKTIWVIEDAEAITLMYPDDY